MGQWNFYFIAKLFLYFGRYIAFDVLANMAFAAFLIVPVRHPRLKLLRQVIAAPAGVALLYHDSWLPSVSRAVSQASQLEGFMPTYLMELTGRFFSPLVVFNLVLLYGVYFFAQKKLRGITPVVLIAMLVPLLPFFSTPSGVEKTIASEPGQYPSETKLPETAAALPDPSPVNTTGATPDISDASGPGKTAPVKTPARTAAAEDAGGNLSGPPTDARLTAALNSFYRQEASRVVSFSPPKKSDSPFDIIFLQICSVSWDDLDFAQERGNPLFRRFDIVLTNFSAAASYSGPAVIRVLRGSCGQQKQGDLYAPPAPECLTFNNLQRIGFEPQLAMNHDGHYGGFLTDVRERGGLKATPFDTKGIPPYLQSFDATPIHDDFAVLSKWWGKRLQMPAERVALFYNSTSLHDGNRYADGRSGDSLKIYQPRLTRLLGDIDRFLTELQTSGRRAVVVFVPEHGASVRGDKMQIAGLREIPSPRISIVPVGIKLVGMTENPAAKPLLVSKPTSYLAVSQLLANFIRQSPFGKNGPNLGTYIRDLPSTDFVAENDETVVMRRGKQYFIRHKDWVEYDPSE